MLCVLRVPFLGALLIGKKQVGVLVPVDAVIAHTLFLEIMHKGVDEGYFRSDVNYELVVKLFDSIGLYMSEKELYQDYSFEELFCNMVFVAIRGFCTIKGIEELDKNLH